MTDQKVFQPPRRRKGSSFKRQRLAMLIGLGAVAVLAVVFAIVWYFTTRVLFVDTDGTKYYAMKKSGSYVLQDTDGNVCLSNSVKNYLTAGGTEVMVDAESGKCTIVSVVLKEGEDKSFNYVSGYDILIYPQMERYDSDTAKTAEKAGLLEQYEDMCIQSIEVVNKKDRYSFVLNKDGAYEIKGNPGTRYDEIMLASLAVAVGKNSVLMRLDDAKVAQYGYAEYGLPQTDAEAEVYFILTSKSGKVTHRVIVGNQVPSGEGFYARYEGRDAVYILRQGSSSEYSCTLEETLLAVLEDYVTPMAVVPMTLTTYFDITDFSLYHLGGLDFSTLPGNALDAIDPIIAFSYIPIELRRGTFSAHLPYSIDGDRMGKNSLDGFTLNSYRTDDCLQNLQMMTPLRTVFLDNETDKAMDQTVFATQYGIAYMLAFTFNAERQGKDGNYKPISDQQYDQILYISPRTEEGTYFVYAEIFDMVVEVSDIYFEFLEWTSFDWIEADIFSGNIGYLEKLEFTATGAGTTAGMSGLNSILFTVDNSASSQELTQSGTLDTSKLKVFASYLAEQNKEVNVLQFRSLYQSLLYSSLFGLAYCDEAEQDAMRASGDEGAYLILRLTYNVDGSSKTLTYRFYAYGGGTYSFVTINGNGQFCIRTNRVNKLLADFGRVFTNEIIDPRETTAY